MSRFGSERINSPVVQATATGPLLAQDRRTSFSGLIAAPKHFTSQYYKPAVSYDGSRSLSRSLAAAPRMVSGHSSPVLSSVVSKPVITKAEVPVMLPMNAAVPVAAPAKATGPFAFVQRAVNDLVNTVHNVWKAALAAVGVLPKTLANQVGGAVASMKRAAEEGLAAGMQTVNPARA